MRGVGSFRRARWTPAKALCIGGATLLSVAFAPTAWSQSCASYPYTLTNGTTADANQVMANFNCAALLGGANFTGYVGIGVAAPQVPLEVSGNIFADSPTVGGSTGSYLTNAGSVVGGYSVNNTANQTYLDFRSNLYMRNTQDSYYTSLSILNNGYVGINTSTPAVQLEVYGASATPTYSPSNSFNPSGAIFAVNATGGNGLSVGVYGLSASYATWLQSGFQGNIVAPYSLILNPFGGSVGIGTSSPVDQLTVTGAGAATASIITSADLGGSLALEDTGAVAGNGGMILFGAAGGLWNFAAIKGYVTNGGGNSQGDIVFSTRPDQDNGALTESMRINSLGYVGIGTASPSQALFVNGVAGGAFAWSSPSDVRLKQNIETIPDALSLVEGLRGVRFQWRPPADRAVGQDLKLPLGKAQLGFIAQEVEKVAPEAVVVPERADAPYAVKEASIVPLLVEAVKAQQAEIAILKDKVAMLETQLAAVRH